MEGEGSAARSASAAAAGTEGSPRTWSRMRVAFAAVTSGILWGASCGLEKRRPGIRAKGGLTV